MLYGGFAVPLLIAAPATVKNLAEMTSADVLAQLNHALPSSHHRPQLR